MKKRYNIPDAQIDSAYDRLQKGYQFIQHDGLYPANTEIVFVRHNNDLIVRERIGPHPCNDSFVDLGLPPAVYDSWKKVAVKNAGKPMRNLPYRVH